MHPRPMSIPDEIRTWEQIATYEQLMAMMAGQDFRVLGRPGEIISYSNEGYVLLAAIVERASGRSFAEYLHARILDPLGLARTGLYTRETPPLEPEETPSWITEPTVPQQPGSAQTPEAAQEPTSEAAPTSEPTQETPEPPPLPLTEQPTTKVQLRDWSDPTPESPPYADATTPTTRRPYPSSFACFLSSDFLNMPSMRSVIKKPPTALVVEQVTAMAPSNVQIQPYSKAPYSRPVTTSDPTSEIAAIALVADMSGVCRSGGTRVMRW